ncbi:hypothetical protein Hanom_Chr15g01381721 [Helianthus anomalus]
MSLILNVSKSYTLGHLTLTQLDFPLDKQKFYLSYFNYKSAQSAYNKHHNDLVLCGALLPHDFKKINSHNNATRFQNLEKRAIQIQTHHTKTWQIPYKTSPPTLKWRSESPFPPPYGHQCRIHAIKSHF